MTWIETGSTICFKPYSLEEALRGLAEAGFENVEIGAVKGFLDHMDPDAPDVDEAQAAGIRLCIETDSNLLPTAQAGLELLAEIDRDWIQINYDPGNVVYYTGAQPEDDIKLALGRIGHVHLKDKRGGKDVLDFPPLGEGELDLAAMLRDLEASGFDGPVSMEIEYRNYEYPPWDECVESARRGKAHWDSLG